MDEWDSVCADLPYCDDLFYVYLCDCLFVFVLSLDAQGLILVDYCRAIYDTIII